MPKANMMAVAIALGLITGPSACERAPSSQNTPATGAGAGAHEKSNLGRLTWSAFLCATYAELSGDGPEQKRLFDIGYEAGKEFLLGIRDGTISDADRQDAPIGVIFLLGGPSDDFIIGRIFENAMGEAFDDVVKEDNAGLPILDPGNWADGELRVSRAQSKYQTSNCALIR